MHRIPSLILALTLPIAAGDSRTWTNPDGTKQFRAEFVSRDDDAVTLRTADKKQLTIAIEKLHEDDRAWLKDNHPTKSEAEVPDAEWVFDTMKFGDDRKAVGEKLKASKMVEANLDGTFFGRTGLNGIYRTVHKIGGLHCHLSFDWDEGDTLKEISLQTENKEPAKYDTELKPCWQELAELISTIHGKPLQATAIPPIGSLTDGQLLASHLWGLEGGGTVLLGTSRLGNAYQVTVRFTSERIGR